MSPNESNQKNSGEIKLHRRRQGIYTFVIDTMNINKLRIHRSFTTLGEGQIVEKLFQIRAADWAAALEEQGREAGEYFVLVNRDPLQVMLVHASDVMLVEDAQWAESML